MNNKNRCFTVFVCILVTLCVLLVAGTKRTSPKKHAKQILSATGVKGGLVVHVNCGDGRMAEYKLKSPPVWDGMAAANGQLYISTQDGSVLCMGRKP